MLRMLPRLATPVFDVGCQLQSPGDSALAGMPFATLLLVELDSRFVQQSGAHS